VTLQPHQQKFARYPAWSGLLAKEFAWVTFVGSKVHRLFKLARTDILGYTHARMA
jgi:hypothetical protein